MNPTTMTVNFDFYDNLKFFKVEFETDSIQRNRLMKIEYEGFSLDIPDFTTMHHDLYIRIMYEVKSQSQTYWDTVNGEITGIPTLDYQNKKQVPINIFDEINKIFFPVIIFLFLPIFSFSQIFGSFEATNHGAGVNVGVITHNIQLKAGVIHSLSSKAVAPNIFYGSAGYQVNITHYNLDNFSFTPLAGVARYHSAAMKQGDFINIDKSVLLIGIEVGKDFTLQNGNEGRYYVFANHAAANFFGIGFKVFIE